MASKASSFMTVLPGIENGVKSLRFYDSSSWDLLMVFIEFSIIKFLNELNSSLYTIQLYHLIEKKYSFKILIY